jgi:hypothetical protein
MRFVAVLGVLIALCAPANAAARVLPGKPHHVIVRPRHALIPSYDSLGSLGIYRDDSVPGGLRTYHDVPPAFDDPSKFGGG